MDFYLKDVPKLDIKDLEYLAENGHYLFRIAIAKRKDCPEYILKKLSQDKFETVQEAVASNENCPIYLLRDLVDHAVLYNKHGVKFNAVVNPSCPIDILEKFYRKYGFACGILKNPNCLEIILEKIVLLQDRYLTIKVIAHKNCTNKILNIIYKNSSISDIEYYLQSNKCPFYFLKAVYKSDRNDLKEFKCKITNHVNWELRDFE